jgi:hypothetical protein
MSVWVSFVASVVIGINVGLAVALVLVKRENRKARETWLKKREA